MFRAADRFPQLPSRRRRCAGRRPGGVLRRRAIAIALTAAAWCFQGTALSAADAPAPSAVDAPGAAPGSKAASKPGSVVAAEALLRRLLPDHADRFVLESLGPEQGRDVFELETVGGRTVVRGSSGVAIASGLNWYLNYFCNCHVSWCGDQLRLPAPLPAVSKKIRRPSPFRYRYCFNYCAFSYTLAFWDWGQWERMIDWMAMHGINMPLAVTGQEKIWQNVGRELGLTDEEIRSFLVGPGYLPFGWMGCIDGWGGPLPQSWIDRHAELQQKILARQRALGMTPVLQGFTGHVPEALKRRFPKAKFQRLPSWCEFPGTYFLDPADPLFERVGKLFVEEQTRLFGTDHLYASDTFIEMSPPSSDPKFLAEMAKAVYRSMAAADPQAVWVMQGWLFVNNPNFWKPPQAKALLGAVPAGRMVLLDLFCEADPAWRKTEAFYGRPWIWCIIQSFGGQVSLHGGLKPIAKDLSEAVSGKGSGKLSGVGLIMEGFGYNPAVFDFVTEMAWHSDVPKLEPWVDGFVRRRYGAAPPEAIEAWRILLDTVYSASGQSGSLLCARPRLDLRYATPYSPERLAEAWEKLQKCGDRLGDIDTFQYDLVNVTRQVLTNHAAVVYGDLVEAYRNKDGKALAEAGRRMLELIDRQDDLLRSRKEFLLGRWLEDAKRWAENDQQRRLYEWNARSLITLWGPRDSILHDYAQREWSGMLRGFYRPRWELFVRELEKSLVEGKPLDENAAEQRLRDWDVKWTRATQSYPVVAAGDPAAISRTLWAKYGRLAAGVEPDVPSLTTGKPATCSAALPPHPARLANDGRRLSTDRYWATDVNADKAAWWQVDLQEPTQVGRVVVVLYYGDNRYYGFTVEGSLDGAKWETLADRRANKAPSTREGVACTFAPREIRYLRVTVTHNSANTGRHLVEVAAFAK